MDDKPAEVKPVKKNKPKPKPGIIYLSCVPEWMTIQSLRQYFEEYGEINRCFFVPIEKSIYFKKGLLFSEGWVEFVKKSKAKMVARQLNNTQVGGKKRYPWYSCIWNIKYLPKFVWTDIQAEDELKKQTAESRMRAEVKQAKQQTNYYAANYEHGSRLDKINSKKAMRGKAQTLLEPVKVKQRLTDDEILAAKKRRREQKTSQIDSKKLKFLEDNEKSHSFVMSSIFGSSS